MRYIEGSGPLLLRPGHMLLMIYRYASGVYQVGDLSALNYVKGFLDGSSHQPTERALTVSGHGIGEAEMWLSERMSGCNVDAMSFRLLDTQLLQFLRSSAPSEIADAFTRFGRMVEGCDQLSRLASDPGLVPYWCQQATSLQSEPSRSRLNVFSDSPLAIPPSRRYDLIYVTHGSLHLSLGVAEALRARLSPHGVLAILLPAFDADTGHTRRFAESSPVTDARRIFRKALESRGYALDEGEKPPVDMAALATRRERIRFSVLASASAVLLGEVILSSLNERVSDRDRIDALEEVGQRFHDLNAPVNEELELSLMEAE